MLSEISRFSVGTNSPPTRSGTDRAFPSFFGERKLLNVPWSVPPIFRRMEAATSHLSPVLSSDALEELGVEGGDELDSGHELADEIFVVGEK
jgi:hypothetical protein